MKSHRRRHRRIRALALVLAACTALAAPAAAEPGADYPQPSTAKIGDTPADFAQPLPRAEGRRHPRRLRPAGRLDAQGAAARRGDLHGGFDWASAAVGAGGAGVLIVVSLGGTALVSRRQIRAAP